MQLNLFHVYRNTPLGRETLLQAADFVKKINGHLRVYLPRFDRFLFYFNGSSVEIRLDESYLYLAEKAEQNMLATLNTVGVEAEIAPVVTMAASNLPRLSTDFDIISLPRVMVERRGQLHLGAIGTGVRQVVKNAQVPALIAPGRFHEWNEILVMFGGSKHSITALKWGIAISQKTGVPVKAITLAEKNAQENTYRSLLDENHIPAERIADWKFLNSRSPIALLDEIPRTALVLMGAYGHGRVHARLFGSKTELIQKNTANLIMVIGEKCNAPGS